MKGKIIGILSLCLMPGWLLGIDEGKPGIPGGDGISDIWQEVYGVAPLDSDEDNDGYTYQQEALLGTDPQDPNSPGDNWFRIFLDTDDLGPTVCFQLDTDSTILYQLEYLFDLPSGNWQEEWFPFGGTGGMMSIGPEQDLTNQSYKFWRVVGLGGKPDTDGDGLDMWEELVGMNLLYGYATDPNEQDSDGDGVNDDDEILGGGNPTQYDYHRSLPSIRIVSGNHQYGSAGAELGTPVVVQLEDRSGNALNMAGQPLTIQSSRGGGRVAASSGGSYGSSLSRTTNASGQATFYIQLGPGPSTESDYNLFTVRTALGNLTSSRTYVSARIGSAISEGTPGSGSGSYAGNVDGEPDPVQPPPPDQPAPPETLGLLAEYVQINYDYTREAWYANDNCITTEKDVYEDLNTVVDPLQGTRTWNDLSRYIYCDEFNNGQWRCLEGCPNIIDEVVAGPIMRSRTYNPLTDFGPSYLWHGSMDVEGDNTFADVGTDEKKAYQMRLVGALADELDGNSLSIGYRLIRYHDEEDYSLTPSIWTATYSQAGADSSGTAGVGQLTLSDVYSDFDYVVPEIENFNGVNHSEERYYYIEYRLIFEPLFTGLTIEEILANRLDVPLGEDGRELSVQMPFGHHVPGNSDGDTEWYFDPMPFSGPDADKFQIEASTSNVYTEGNAPFTFKVKATGAGTATLTVRAKTLGSVADYNGGWQDVEGPSLELGAVRIDLVAGGSGGGEIIVSNYYSAPLEEASGPKYRKIGLNGLPLPDEKPQAEEETDQEPEETYIDALSRSLRHSVTDVYAPLPASDLALSVRRNTSSEVRSDYSGLRPHERPDLPFGPGWSSNVCATIDIVEQVAGPAEVTRPHPFTGEDYDYDIPGETLVVGIGKHYRHVFGLSQIEPNYAYVTDENGMRYRFAIEYDDTGAITNFIPKPNGEHEQETYQVSLAFDGTNYTLTRKHGTTLVYENAGTVLRTANDRLFGSYQQSRHTYARLKTVTDRLNNTVTYSYGGAGVIPTGIQGAGMSIAIDQSGGRVTAVRCPRGFTTSYGYSTFNYTQISNSVSNPQQTFPTGNTLAQSLQGLTGVTHPDGAGTSYGYGVGVVESGDNRLTYGDSILNKPPEGPTKYPDVYRHFDVASITDANANTYTFSYSLSEAKWITVKQHTYDWQLNLDTNDYYWKQSPGTTTFQYAQNGQPQVVTGVTLPNGESVSISGTHEVRFDPSTGAIVNPNRVTTVTDAENNLRTYTWSSPEVQRLEGSYDLNSTIVGLGSGGTVSKTVIDPRIVYYNSLSISYPEGGSESFTFDPTYGMAVTSLSDWSGNMRSYTHQGNFTDPLSQTTPIGTKSFTYGAHRIMDTLTDEEGRVTEYGVDSMGRRTRETLKDSSGKVVSETQYTYGNATYPGFMTRKTMLSKNTIPLGGTWASHVVDPAWATTQGNLVTEYTPTSNGRIFEEIVDPGGLHLITTYTYDATGNRTTVTDPRGYTTTFSYDERNRLITTSFPDGSQRHHVYDPRGNKIQDWDENGIVTFLEYDNFNRLSKQTRDLNLNYQADTRAGGDLVTEYQYNHLNSRTQIIDPRGYTTWFDYDDLQRLTTQTIDLENIGTKDGDTLDIVTSYHYSGANPGMSAFDSEGFKPTSIIDPRGYTTYMQYDSMYRLVGQATQYDLTTNEFAVTQTTYDQVGNPVRRTVIEDGIPHVTSATDLTSLTGIDDQVTETDFDALNRPIETRFGVTMTGNENPAYGKINRAYTATGFQHQAIDEEGRITYSEYDQAGRPTRVLQPAVDDYNTSGADSTAPETLTEYDQNGNVTATINPLGQRWEFIYDERNRKIQEKQPAVTHALTGQSQQPLIDTEYDAVGNVISVLDANHNLTETFYDAAYRPVLTIAPKTHIYGMGQQHHAVTFVQYDANGNVEQTIQGGALSRQDALAALQGTALVNERLSADNSYDSANRLTRTVDAQSIVVDYAYDRSGNRTAVYDGEYLLTEFIYDGLARNTEIRHGVSTPGVDFADRMQYGFNAVNKTSRTDGEGRYTTYQYDLRNRLQSVDYANNGSDRIYTYDKVGNLDTVTEPSMANNAADVIYQYDDLNRIIQETSGGVTHLYAYDLAGNRRETIYGGTGLTCVSTYDALNRLQTMTESGRQTTYRYDLNGNIVEKELPNGDLCYTTFDALNRQILINADTGSGTDLYHYFYDYDLFGNLARVDEAYQSGSLPSRTITNTYDHSNRLIAEEIEDVLTTYSYDDSHNRRSKTVTGGPNPGETIYDFSNQLNQLEGYTLPNGDQVTFTYDANGNRATKTYTPNGGSSVVDTYTYDFENRLIELDYQSDQDILESDDRGIYQYQYDYRTRRVNRNESGAGGANTNVVFSGGTSVQEYDNSASSPSVEYLRGSDYGGGIGGVLYTLRSGTRYYTHNNSRGDIVHKAIGDSAGARTISYEAQYEAFGTRTFEEGTDLDRQKANSKDEDPHGLLNEGFRYRDLEAGIFITRDPLGFVDGPNVYTFVNQNPWTKFDPLGLATKDQLQKERSSKQKSYSEKLNRYDKMGPSDEKHKLGKELRQEKKELDEINARITRITETARYVQDKLGKGGDKLESMLDDEVVSHQDFMREVSQNRLKSNLVIEAGVVAGGGPAFKIGGAIFKRVGGQLVRVVDELASTFKSGVKTPSVGDKVTRHWGGKSSADGASWTRDPASKQTRENLGLDKSNTGEFVSEGTLIDTTRVTARRAKPWGGFKGGGDEILVPDPNNQIRLNSVRMPDSPLPNK